MDVRRLLRLGALPALAGLLFGVALARAQDPGPGPVKLTPQQFDREVRRGARKADEKYRGKTVELTGKVIRAVRHFSGKPLVELQAGNPYSGVLCFTAEKEPWGTVAPGQTVKVTGKFPDFPAVPSLEDCAVEPVTESRIRAVTAEALARECEADPRGAAKKLEKQTLRVSGTVASREPDARTGFTDVTLRCAGKTRVACRLIPAEKESGAALEVGRPATLVGQFGGAYEGQVHIDTALVLHDTK